MLQVYEWVACEELCQKPSGDLGTKSMSFPASIQSVQWFTTLKSCSSQDLPERNPYCTSDNKEFDSKVSFYNGLKHLAYKRC